jgi:hypothetical protein
MEIRGVPDPKTSSFGYLIDPFIYALLAAFCRMVEVWNEQMFEFNIQFIDCVPNKQEMASNWNNSVPPSPTKYILLQRNVSSVSHN